MIRSTLIASTIAATLLASSAHASVIYTFQQGVGGYAGTQDAEVDSSAPDSNTGGSTFFALTRTGDIEQAYVQFDNIFGNGSGQIPVTVTGDDIVSATLRIVRDSGSNTPMRAFQIDSDWSESTITWNDQPGGGTLIASNVSNNIQVLDVTASLKAWADGTDNFGWRLDAGTTGGNRSFWDSSESSTTADRPLLTVEVVPEPASLVLLGLGGLCLLGGRTRQVPRS